MLSMELRFFFDVLKYLKSLFLFLLNTISVLYLISFYPTHFNFPWVAKAFI